MVCSVSDPTVQDVLQATKPPLSLLNYLSRRAVRLTLPPAALAWVERWDRIYAGQPDQLFDRVTGIDG